MSFQHSLKRAWHRWVARVVAAVNVLLAVLLAIAVNAATSALPPFLGEHPGLAWALVAVFTTCAIFFALLGRTGHAPGVEQTRGPGNTLTADAELFPLLESWTKPAFEAARHLLERARTELCSQEDALKSDLATVFQRTLDDGNRAYSLASNAIVHQDGTDPEQAMGDLYRAYQGMSTWIERGLHHGAVHPDDFWYREWRKADPRFLDEVKRAIGGRQLETLRREVYAVGWGESVRDKLPSPSISR